MPGLESADFYDYLDNIFSRAAEIYDSKIQANFINRNIRTIEVQTLLRYSAPNMRVLELGHGTGEEALKYIAKTGNRVTGIDISSGMAKFAMNKMIRHGFEQFFESRIIPASCIGDLDGKFDIVYSFNGLINTEPNLTKLMEGLTKITHRGSIFIASFRNTSCFGERILSLSKRGRAAVRQRKSREINVEVVGEKVPSRYYSPSEIVKIMGKNFRIQQILGLAVLFPPYLADRIPGPYAPALISMTERFLGRLPVLNSLGDEVLIVAKRS